MVGEDSILCELNPEYVNLIHERVEMVRTDTGGAAPPKVIVGQDQSFDMLKDLFG